MGSQVAFSLDAGEIVSISRNGVVVALPSGTQSTYGTTDDYGQIIAVVTRLDEGYVRLAGTVTQCDSPVLKTASVWFYRVEIYAISADALHHFCLDDLTVIPVPEPSSIIALLTGLAGIGGMALKRRRV